MLNEFPMGDLVFVTVGTDHHPFDRLCAWADAWVKAARHPEIPWFVQSGTSKPPVAAPHRDYIGYDEMCSSMSRAVAVVCHGGPATIMDARRLGRVPIVVPRSADIGGFGRSGSTLVERILGQLPGFCSAGEIVFLWQRGLIDGQLCGCGAPVPECDFWARVGKSAYGGWDQIDAHEMLALQKRVDR